MTELTSAGLLRILGVVTAIMVVPMVGGTVVGLIADAGLGTSPLWALGGLAIGTLVSAVGIWLYIRAHRTVARGRHGTVGKPAGERDEP